MRLEYEIKNYDLGHKTDLLMEGKASNDHDHLTNKNKKEERKESKAG